MEVAAWVARRSRVYHFAVFLSFDITPDVPACAGYEKRGCAIANGQMTPRAMRNGIVRLISFLFDL